MLYASESAFFLDERSPPTPPPGASNSSGWPSLINIQSAVSLLSSYTPQKTTAASSQLDEATTSANAVACSVGLSPINDVDECCRERLVSTRMELEQENEHEQIHSTPRTPVFSDKAPFTFTMAPPPAADDSNNHRSGNDRHYHDQQMAADDAVRSSDRRPISPKALRKIYSRRQRQKHRERKSSDGAVEDSGGPWMTESEEEDDDKASNDSRRIVPQQHQHQQTSERLQMHRDLPYVISGYLQLGFNVFMVGTVLVIVVNVLLTIRRDVNAKVQAYSAEILHEIAGCTKQYADNQCDPLMRVPAMEPLCAAWESCMHRDPTKVGRAKVSAETLAEIVNGFIDPISFKTMLFFVLLFVGTLLVSNFAFGAYRQNRVYKQHVRRKQHVPGIQQQQQLQQLQLQSKRPQAQQNANQSRRRRAAGALPPPPLY